MSERTAEQLFRRKVRELHKALDDLERRFRLLRHLLALPEGRTP